MWKFQANKLNCYYITRPDGSMIHFDANGTGLDSAKDLHDTLAELVDAANGTKESKK